MLVYAASVLCLCQTLNMHYFNIISFEFFEGQFWQNLRWQNHSLRLTLDHCFQCWIQIHKHYNNYFVYAIFYWIKYFTDFWNTKHSVKIIKERSKWNNNYFIYPIHNKIIIMEKSIMNLAKATQANHKRHC